MSGELSRSKKVAFCGIIAALGAAIMLCAYFPYATYAAPAVAGVFMLVAAVEISPKWACLSFVVSAVIALITAEPEAKLFYVLFFGYYPILKGVLERINNRVVEYILKFLVFNAAIITAAWLAACLLSLPLEEIPSIGKYSALVFLAIANVTFFVYDFALTRLVSFYMSTVHVAVKKILK